MDTETAVEWLGIVALGCLIFLIMWFAMADKPVLRYNLYSSGAYLTLNVDTDNTTDSSIPLIGVSYERAVAIVDSLNSELQRHPRLK
jgi:hypothetical protein